MKNRSASKNRPTPRVLPVVAATTLAMAFTASLPEPAHADQITAPRTPASITVPVGNKSFLKGHAVGTQNYICLPSGSGVAWALFTPQATLFDDAHKQIATHYFSPDPLGSGAFRATWQDGDASTVWGQATATAADQEFVAPGAIPWVLLQKVAAQAGPTGGKALAATTFVQRLNTSGGIAPSTGCSLSTDIGKKASVPYSADYFFFSQSR